MQTTTTRNRVVAVLATLAGFAGTASAASAAETLVLDFATPSGPDAIGPVSSSSLVAGQGYVVTVSGTVSLWTQNLFLDGSPICGIPEVAPVYPSPSKANGPVGWDAATLFAAPAVSRPGPNQALACQGFAIPAPSLATNGGFVVSTNGSSGQFTHPTPFGGVRTVPRADHTYSYEITGTGSPASFKFIDNPSFDDYGRLWITVRTAAECAAINCLGNASLQSDATAKPVSTVDPDTIGIQGAKATCSRFKVLSLRLRQKVNGVDLAKVSIRRSGKLLRVVKRRDLRKAIKLRNLAPGAVKLNFRVVTAGGQVVKFSRTYAACTSGRVIARPVTIKK